MAGGRRIIRAFVTAGVLIAIAVAAYQLAAPDHQAASSGALRDTARAKHIASTIPPRTQAAQPASSQGRPSPVQPAAVRPAGGRPSAVRPAGGRPAGGTVSRPPVAPAVRKTQQPVRATVCHQASLNGSDVTAVGDSVMIDATPGLQADLPGIYVDAMVGRQMSTGVQIVQSLAVEGALRHVVVVGLGTNGTVDPSQILALRQAIGPGRELILVTVYGPMSWTSEVNATLISSASQQQHVAIADWASAIARQPGLLWGDGIHPQPSTGGVLYAQVVTAAIRANEVTCTG